MNNRLSIVVPAYNEEGNLEDTLAELRTALQSRHIDYEIIIVNDGSQDRTGALAEALASADPRVRVLHNAVNLGLAKTFWVGIREARSDYVGWIPGDNGFPASSLERWLAPLGQADLIQTYLLNAEVRYVGRRIISRGYTRAMNALFGFDIKYYNGIQIYRAELINSVTTHSDGFALLSEILVKLLAKGSSYIEVGINMQERVQGQSKAVRLKNILDVLKTVMRLFIEIKVVHRQRYRLRGVKRPWPPQAVATDLAVGNMDAEYGQSL
jgi:glycosyltransferase involved in cell wall biosynthesis